MEASLLMGYSTKQQTKFPWNQQLTIMVLQVYLDKDKDKDLFIGPHEFLVGYSKAPEQP